MPKKPSPSDKTLVRLREVGLAYPGAHTKSPWPGHLDLAVNDKTFAYLSLEGEPFRISCKLPQSSSIALLLPFTEPAAYGLGKSGWVTATFPAGAEPPVDDLLAWIDESYRAQAPKKLVAQLEGGAATKQAVTPATKRSTKVAAPKATKTATPKATKGSPAAPRSARATPSAARQGR